MLTATLQQITQAEAAEAEATQAQIKEQTRQATEALNAFTPQLEGQASLGHIERLLVKDEVKAIYRLVQPNEGIELVPFYVVARHDGLHRDYLVHLESMDPYKTHHYTYSNSDNFTTLATDANDRLVFFTKLRQIYMVQQMQAKVDAKNQEEKAKENRVKDISNRLFVSYMAANFPQTEDEAVTLIDELKTLVPNTNKASHLAAWQERLSWRRQEEARNEREAVHQKKIDEATEQYRAAFAAHWQQVQAIEARNLAKLPALQETVNISFDVYTVYYGILGADEGDGKYVEEDSRKCLYPPDVDILSDTTYHRVLTFGRIVPTHFYTITRETKPTTYYPTDPTSPAKSIALSGYITDEKLYISPSADEEAIIADLSHTLEALPDPPAAPDILSTVTANEIKRRIIRGTDNDLDLF